MRQKVKRKLDNTATAVDHMRNYSNWNGKIFLSFDGSYETLLCVSAIKTVADYEQIKSSEFKPFVVNFIALRDIDGRLCLIWNLKTVRSTTFFINTVDTYPIKNRKVLYRFSKQQRYFVHFETRVCLMRPFHTFKNYYRHKLFEK